MVRGDGVKPVSGEDGEVFEVDGVVAEQVDVRAGSFNYTNGVIYFYLLTGKQKEVFGTDA